MKFNREIIDMNYPPLKITEETRRKVLENPRWHLNCPVRIRMGKFYTDEEWEKRENKVLSMKLPGYRRRLFNRKK